ncbi:MAG: thrombospondin type 3 repeat-containing protein [Phycisphaerales bacterium]|nr:thrombospondin type 3 repeat-containing protein [Phycisphaerales bacterium]
MNLRPIRNAFLAGLVVMACLTQAMGQEFSNPAFINIPPVEQSPYPPYPGNGFTKNIANPYPSEIVVSGVTEPFALEVTIHGYSHTNPIKTDILLVPPPEYPNRSVVLMHDIQASNDAVNATLTFADGAPSLSSPVVTGTYRPTMVGTRPEFLDPAPFPNPPYATDFSAIYNMNINNVNGTWRLYVMNWGYQGYLFGDAGQISGGWTIRFVHDTDGDGYFDNQDNCPDIYNPEQEDDDYDGVGNPCDMCPLNANPDQADGDGDGFGDACDNCPLIANSDQANNDDDFFGDVCDNCPDATNGLQTDADSDGFGDACDTYSGINIENITQGTAHPTIQSAIDAAFNGDKIVLGPCDFYEDNITFPNGLNVTVRGAGMDQTFLHGGDDDSDFVLGIQNTNQTSATLISNMTITNSGATAIRTNNTDPTIRLVRFQDVTGGNALDLRGGSRVDRCIFTGATSNYQTVYVAHESEAMPTFYQCLFANNEVTYDLVIDDPVTCRVINCTLAGGSSGAIQVRSGAQLDMYNSIILHQMNVSGTLNADSNIFNGATGNNIDGRPTFVDEAGGDYHLAPGSLGIDAANEIPIIGTGVNYDLAGDPRYVDDAGTVNTGYGFFEYLDMGAYEFQGLTDSDNDGVGDADDRCPGYNDSIDADTDGVPDQCDACPGYDDFEDADGDGAPDHCDPCPEFANESDMDSDGDGTLDDCDTCPIFDNRVDVDGDGVPDGCDICPGYDDATQADMCADPQVVTRPLDLNESDRYRLLFVTDARTKATSNDIAYYNALAAADAANVPRLNALGTEWKALVSTSTIDARDNTDTNFNVTNGVPIYLVDGTRLANDYAHLWNQSGPYPVSPSITSGLNGAAVRVWTGTHRTGVQQVPMGATGSESTRGYPYYKGGACWGYEEAHQSGLNPIYVISEILQVPCVADSDGDGVCDSSDICLGFDDFNDADGDGVPDGCDMCEGYDDAFDCDSNGIPDGCDLDHRGRFDNFSSTNGAHYTLNQNANTSVVVENGSVRLTEVLQGQKGSVIFEPVLAEPIADFTVEFDYWMGGGNGADGMAFALIDADSTGMNVLFGESGDNQPLVVSLDTYRGGPAGGNHALLISYGQTLADVLVDHQLDNAQWQHAWFAFENGAATLVLYDSEGNAATIFSDVAVPGFAPIRARYGFGARTGGVTNEHRVDNVLFLVTSTTNDCNTNGIPDTCEAGGNVDSDGDGIYDLCDTCPLSPNVWSVTRNTYHATIQNAIDASSSGDVIELGACVFVERDLKLDNKSITLRGQDAESTIIDGNGVAGRILDIINGGNNVIEDITFRNGLRIGSVGGAALTVRNSSVATIRRCRFENNEAREGAGGAIRLNGGSTSTFQECAFHGNKSNVGESAVFLLDSQTTASFVNTLFAGNGGNVAQTIRCKEGSMTFANCTFADTLDDRVLRTGSGGVITIKNCVHDLTSVPDADIAAERCLYHGATGDNIDGVPTFVDDANGDFRLAPGSLGVDAADYHAYIAVNGDATDLNGDPRAHDDTGYADTGSGAVTYLDMGAFEFQGMTECGVGGDIGNDGDVDLADYARFASCLSGPSGGLAPNCACFDQDNDGDVDMVDYSKFQVSFTGSN